MNHDIRAWRMVCAQQMITTNIGLHQSARGRCSHRGTVCSLLTGLALRLRESTPVKAGLS